MYRSKFNIYIDKAETRSILLNVIVSLIYQCYPKFYLKSTGYMLY